MDNLEKIEAILDHIQHVQKNCNRLGIKLIKSGRFELGRMLIANGQIHDNSKLKGLEFNALWPGHPLLRDAIFQHASTNPHHPEYWGNIKNMPEVYIAEMVCDCTARSGEFGSDIRNWFTMSATTKYDFTMEDEVGKKITYFLDLLLEPAFK